MTMKLIRDRLFVFQAWLTKKLEQQGGKESLQYMVERLEQEKVKINRSEPKSQPPLSSDKASKAARLKKISSKHLLVATLIATVTFTAAFTVPGGYNGEHGKAVMWERPYFTAFAVADSAAFFCAAAAVLLNFFMSAEQNYHLLLRFAKVAALFIYFSLFATLVAFTSGLRVVMPAESHLADYTLVSGVFFVSLFFIGFL